MLDASTSASAAVAARRHPLRYDCSRRTCSRVSWRRYCRSIGVHVGITSAAASVGRPSPGLFVPTANRVLHPSGYKKSLPPSVAALVPTSAISSSNDAVRYGSPIFHHRRKAAVDITVYSRPRSLSADNCGRIPHPYQHHAPHEARDGGDSLSLLFNNRGPLNSSRYNTMSVQRRSGSELLLAQQQQSSAAEDNEGAHLDESQSESLSVRPYLGALLRMCRPVNFPIVMLFHILGAQQATHMVPTASVVNGSGGLLKALLLHPSMIVTLLALLLVTSTSMITNDYYDARSGVDSVPRAPSVAVTDGTREVTDQAVLTPQDYHPLATGSVPLPLAKKFDSYLYALLLLISALVPGAPARLMVLGGAIVTYLYTEHLKPKTWIKNISCAALVALSPVTSGLAGWYVLQQGRVGVALSVGASVSFSLSVLARKISVCGSALRLLFFGRLGQLVTSLFFGILSRELLMDVTDTESDAAVGIQTVPVKYGKRFASKVALIWSVFSGAAACANPFVWLFRGGEEIKGVGVLELLKQSRVQKLLLAFVGSGLMIRRAYQVCRTEGKDVNLTKKAVEESLLSVLLVLASFA